MNKKYLLKCIGLFIGATINTIFPIEIKLKNKIVDITPAEQTLLINISKTIENLIADVGPTGQIDLSLISQHDFNFIRRNLNRLANIETNENYTKIKNDLTPLDDQQLKDIVYAANYLEIPTLLNIAISNFAERAFSDTILNAFSNQKTFQEYINNPAFQIDSRDISSLVIQEMPSALRNTWLLKRPIKEFVTLQGHTQPITSIAFSPAQGDNRIATGSEDGTVRISDGSTGDLIKTINLRHPVRSVSWSRDGSLLAMASTTGITIFKNLQFFKIIPEGSNFARLSPNGDHIAFTSPFNIKIFDIQTLSPQSLQGIDPKDSPIFLSWSPNNTFLATVFQKDVKHDFKGYIRIWNYNNGEIIVDNVKIDSIYAPVTWNPYSTLFASSNLNNIRVWNLEKQEVQTMQKLDAYLTYSLDWSSNGLALAEGTSRNEFFLYSTETWKQIHSIPDWIQENGNRIKSQVSWSSDGYKLATAIPEIHGPTIQPQATHIARIWTIINPELAKELDNFTLHQVQLLVYMTKNNVTSTNLPGYLKNLFETLPEQIRKLF